MFVIGYVFQLRFLLSTDSTEVIRTTGPTIMIFDSMAYTVYRGYHKMPQKACERGFCHVIAFS